MVISIEIGRIVNLMKECEDLEYLATGYMLSAGPVSHYVVGFLLFGRSSFSDSLLLSI